MPDIWGQNIRNVESLDAQTEQQQFQLEAAYLTLSANVVTAAIQEASLRGQIAATQRIIKIERDILGILKNQFNAGQAAQVDVLAQEAALAQAEQTLPPLQKQLAVQRDLLTALAGHFSADEILQKFDLAGLTLPATCRSACRAHVVRQRPDVRAAEAAMHSASALVGVADRRAAAQHHADRPIPASARGVLRADVHAGDGYFYTVAASATQSDVRRHDALPQAEGGRGGAGSGRRAVPPGGDHGDAECRRRPAQPAGRCPRGAGSDQDRKRGQGESRDHPEAA